MTPKKRRRPYDETEDAFLEAWAVAHPEYSRSSRKLWKRRSLAPAWARRLPGHKARSPNSMLYRYLDFVAPGAREAREAAAEKVKEPVVYILALFCRSHCCSKATDLRDQRTYVGETNDLERRLRQHNGARAGGPEYTAGRRSCPQCGAEDGEWRPVVTVHGFRALGGLPAGERYLQTKTVEAWIQRLERKEDGRLLGSCGDELALIQRWGDAQYGVVRQLRFLQERLRHEFTAADLSEEHPPLTLVWWTPPRPVDLPPEPVLPQRFVGDETEGMGVAMETSLSREVCSGSKKLEVTTRRKKRRRRDTRGARDVIDLT